MYIQYILDILIKIGILTLLVGLIKIVLYDIHMIIRDIHKCLDRKTMVYEEERRRVYLKNMERQNDMDEYKTPYLKRGYEYKKKNEIKKVCSRHIK